ncbi:MAG: NAD(P)-dependent dehydrogenase (short-subunit alcohol dehydrogenase family) [Bacteroidia bacterium]|jgi:NAD(P)-dependent dehydrogenase (short-subunit alcohol dehydrogenase family)
MSTKTVLVTGGASGIGRAFVRSLVTQGWLVCVADTNALALEELASAGVNVFECDVTNLEQVKVMVKEIESRFGAIDRLIHCAAIMPAGKLADMAAQTTNLLMSVNYGGTVNVVTTVLQDMLVRDAGEMIVFGSSGGAVPVPDCGAYCASKAATNAYMEILAEENRECNVQFMLVCPPLVNTPLLEQAMATAQPKMLSYSLDQQRYMTPDDIVDAVERGLKKKITILWPSTEAKILQWLRRFSPRLLWRIIHAAN